MVSREAYSRILLFFGFLLLQSSVVSTAEYCITEAGEECIEYDERELAELPPSELKRKIAKLFVVGIDADYLNSSRNPNLDELIEGIGVGGIMLNAYNLPESELLEFDNRQAAFSAAQRLIEAIHQRVEEGRVNPLIFVDFESDRFSSIKYPLVSPPSALTISSTYNTEFAFYAGAVTGEQLKRFGVDVILGPVLDSDKASSQGRLNSTINNRSFSDNLDVIELFAKRYIEGINEAGIGVITKHFPSYSSVSENPHSEIPVYTGSLDNIKKDLDPFAKNCHLFDGIMTSHLRFERYENKLFTFNKDAMSEVLLEPIRNQNCTEDIVLITDDLSDMSATVEYMELMNYEYEDVALEAFKAGHDLLLFSHTRGDDVFTNADLVSSIDMIYEYVISNSSGMVNLVKSLDKVENFRREIKESQVSGYYARELDYNNPDLLNDSNYHNLESFLVSLYNAASIGLKRQEFPSMAEASLDPTSTFTLFASRSSYGIFDEEFGGDSNMDVRMFESQEPAERYDEIVSALSDSALVYIVIENVDDVNAIHRFAYETRSHLSKLVFLMHQNPKILYDDIITYSNNIYGNFSRSPESFLADIRMIKGDLKPNPLSQLPIELNDGNFYKPENMSPIDEDIESGEFQIFNTDRERQLSEENEGLTKEIGSLQNRIDELLEGPSHTPDKPEPEPKGLVSNRVELGYTVGALSIIFLGIIINICLLFGVYISKNIKSEEGWREYLTHSARALFIKRYTNKGLLISLYFLFFLVVVFLFPNDVGLSYLSEQLSDFPILGYVLVVLEDMYPGDFYLEEVYFDS